MLLRLQARRRISRNDLLRNRSIGLKSQLENHFPSLRPNRTSLNKPFTRVLPQDMTSALTHSFIHSLVRLLRVRPNQRDTRERKREWDRKRERARSIFAWASWMDEINARNSVDRMDRVARGSFRVVSLFFSLSRSRI